jgi:hypothetical protein
LVLHLATFQLMSPFIWQPVPLTSCMSIDLLCTAYPAGNVISIMQAVLFRLFVLASSWISKTLW